MKHPKGKGNISIEKGIRSKVKCRPSAHFPPIWAIIDVFVGPGSLKTLIMWNTVKRKRVKEN